MSTGIAKKVLAGMLAAGALWACQQAADPFSQQQRGGFSTGRTQPTPMPDPEQAAAIKADTQDVPAADPETSTTDVYGGSGTAGTAMAEGDTSMRAMATDGGVVNERAAGSRGAPDAGIESRTVGVGSLDGGMVPVPPAKPAGKAAGGQAADAGRMGTTLDGGSLQDRTGRGTGHAPRSPSRAP